MNRSGYIVVAAAALVLAVLTIFPPRCGSGDSNWYLSRGFLFSTGKQLVKIYSDADRTQYGSTYAMLDYRRLFLESWVVMLLAVALLAIMRARRKSIRENDTSQQ